MSVTPPAPTKVIAVHLNYRDRAAERGRLPEVPSYFLKPISSIARDGDPVVRPLGTELLNFEGEIAIIIREHTRNVTPERGLDRVGWYAPANDLGLYDLRWADRGSNLLSKGQDGFTPIGAAVPADRVDPEALTLRTRVNGEVVQEDRTSNLLFPFGLLVADLSRFISLEPGDVILTGTPAGSRPVQPGDVVEVEVDGLGRVRNPIVEGSHQIPPFGAQPTVTPRARADALGTAAPRPVVLSEEARAALRTVSTATLTGQLSRRGLRSTVIRGVRPTRPELRLVGYALTVRYVPLREDVRDADVASPNAQRRAIDSIGPEEVLVIDARQDPGAGTIGDILAARVFARGAAGIVTDGGLRDSSAVARLDLPTYYQAPHPAALGLIHHPLEANVPVACGGALVMPGDVIVGDADAALVLPAAMAEEVARDAVEQEEREAWALERVLAGESIQGVFPLSDDRRPDYEAWRRARRPGPNGEAR
jgi:2-keto-4-pentenoate hydratase/2-oxohepta-3-ene-1,7-dioic acid hydratase in catechol pathway/regulator of RNase E activity RraA